MPTISNRDAIEMAARHLAAGRLPEAAAIFEDVLRQQPSSTDALCGLGGILLKRGELEKGFDLIAQAVALSPADGSMVGNLAIAYMACGKLQEAEDCARRALDLAPEKAGLHATFAGVLLARNKTAAALEAQRHAVDLAPGLADQRFNLGNILVAAGRPDGALAEFQVALDVDPDHAGAINNLALLHKQAGRLESALALLDRARLQDPLNPRLMTNRADVLSQLGRHAEALEAVTRAAALSPKDPRLQRSLGAVLLEVGDLTQAAKVLAAVLRATPDDPIAAGLLAKLMRRQGRLDEAQVIVDHAKSLNAGPSILDPFAVEVLLMRGRYPDAWALVNSLAHQVSPPSSRLELTEDCDIDGKDIRLISFDSSAALFAARFLPSLRARGAVLKVVCPPVLARLFETLTAVDTVVPMDEVDLPSLRDEGNIATRLDYLPHLLRATPDSPSVEGPLFNIAPAVVPMSGTPRRVGLWWEGTGPGAALPEALSCVAGVSFVSLQTGSVRDDARASIASAPFVDRSEAVSDFRDLAEEIGSLNRMIVSDGPVAHLAAALGVETWVLVDRDGSWYWLGNSNLSPWYPNVRVFRQGVDGSWTAALEAICQALA